MEWGGVEGDGVERSGVGWGVDGMEIYDFVEGWR